MAKTLTTPTDSPAVDPKTGGRSGKTPKRGQRYRLFDDGAGDVCVYQIAPMDSGMPEGTLVPIPTAPRFDSSRDAEKWTRANGAELDGIQVMIFKALGIHGVEVEARPQVRLISKPKVPLN